MDIGPLPYVARLEYKTSSQDPTYGTELITWTLKRVIKVGLQDVLPSRAEVNTQGLPMATRPVRVRGNYCTDIDSSMRLIIMRPDETVYQITGGPAVLGNKAGIEMMCAEYSS